MTSSLPEKSTSREVPIRLMSVDDFRAWHGRGRSVDYAAHVQRIGAPFAYVIGAGFRWTCPDCGEPHLARVGDEPISGWENPQWVVIGPYETPSATPSLGCGQMRTDPSGGHHWWLRDGKLVRA